VRNQPADAAFVLTEMLRRSAQPDDPFSGLLDGDHVAAAGHSAGAITTLGLFDSCCRDQRLSGGLVLAGNSLGFGGEEFAGGAAPILFEHGDQDRVVPYRSGRRAFEAVPWPKANILFLAGSYRRALAEFQAVEAQLTQRYGPTDDDVLTCRFYAATCRAELGENTEALHEFRAFLNDWFQIAGPADDRALEVRRHIGVLLATTGHYDEARATLTALHHDLITLHGEASPDAALLAALLDRISRYET
jgi:hypothetical protein